jgi:lipoprotein NlpD
MLVRLISLAVALSLSGCFSKSPKQAVIVIEKSSNLENINHQRLSKFTITQPKLIAKNNNSTKNISQKKHKKTTQKIPKKSPNWSTPVNAKISKKYSKDNSGLVFNTHKGQKISSIRDGKIIYIGNNMKSYGQIIIIRHPLGFSSTYTQTKNLRVKLGDLIKQGEVIASTNNQPFYFEIKKFNQTINPLKYLK